LERREEPRRRVATLAANYFEGSSAASYVVRDISTKSAFLLDDVKWLLGTIRTLTLEETGSPGYSQRPPLPVVLRTKVVRCAQDGLGVQFVFLSKEERQSLADFLEKANLQSSK
jgi:hypothetical protein